MDIAYDNIIKDALPQSPHETPESENKETAPAATTTLNSDFAEAYKAISSSPWGARLGDFFGSVVKQGESVYSEASKELKQVSSEAQLGLGDIKSAVLDRSRALSILQQDSTAVKKITEENAPAEKETSEEDALKESEGVLARLRLEASKRLKDIEKAEDAADEALLKFGTNIRNFLRDAVSIAAPTGDNKDTVLFESKDSQGKRVIHTTRFDAQLHVIHSSLDSFTKDPASKEYGVWVKSFDADSKTGDINKDLETFTELRTSMEKLVPDTVAYPDFWKRYYFLRHSIETAEARRRDLLKGATAETEEDVAWDEDSDDESPTKTKSKTEASRPASVESSTTLHPARTQATEALTAPRKSHDEKSEADSEKSYDVVGATSGVPSRAPDSPKESPKGDDSEEEDWE